MRHRQTIAILSLVGFFVALYLWLHNIGVIGTLQCGAGACDRVQSSPYAYFLGIPVAFYGVVGYAVLFAVSVAGLQPRLATSGTATLALAVLASGGLLFSGYLTYLELFVIRAICQWCVASAVIITVIWVVALAAWLREHRVGSST